MDVAWLALYALFLLGVSARLGRQDAPEEYFLAGRRVTTPVFVASLVSTWYGGILGVGEYSFTHGISNWLVFGVPYYLAALVFALLVAPRARRSGFYTIPDQLLRAYGLPAALGGALVVFVMTAPAAYVLQVGILLREALGWPMGVAVAAGTVVSLVYVVRGGLKGDLITDVVQFTLMFLGFALLVGYASRRGGVEFLREHLPASHFVWHGGRGAGYVLTWYFIALSTLVEPAFYQRCYAARTPRVAQRGIMLSILFWMCFDFLSTSAGMYARALVPSSDPVAAYPRLAALVLPPMARGLFTVALLAVVMSTLDSSLFLAATTLGRDVLWRLRATSHATAPRYTRWCLVGTAAVAVGLALWLRSVVDIWHHLGSVGTSALALPTALSFFPRVRPSSRGAVAMMAVGSGLSLGWLVWPSFPWAEGYPWGLQPIFPGLGGALVTYLLDLACRKRAAARRLPG